MNQVNFEGDQTNHDDNSNKGRNTVLVIAAMAVGATFVFAGSEADAQAISIEDTQSEAFDANELMKSFKDAVTDIELHEGGVPVPEFFQVQGEGGVASYSDALYKDAERLHGKLVNLEELMSQISFESTIDPRSYGHLHALVRISIDNLEKHMEYLKEMSSTHASVSEDHKYTLLAGLYNEAERHQSMSPTTFLDDKGVSYVGRHREFNFFSFSSDLHAVKLK